MRSGILIALTRMDEMQAPRALRRQKSVSRKRMPAPSQHDAPESLEGELMELHTQITDALLVCTNVSSSLARSQPGGLKHSADCRVQDCALSVAASVGCEHLGLQGDPLLSEIQTIQEILHEAFKAGAQANANLDAAMAGIAKCRSSVPVSECRTDQAASPPTKRKSDDCISQAPTFFQTLQQWRVRTCISSSPVSAS